MVEVKAWPLVMGVELVVGLEGFNFRLQWQPRTLVQHHRVLSQIFRDVAARLAMEERRLGILRAIGASKTITTLNNKSSNLPWEASFNHSMSMPTPSNQAIVQEVR